MAAMTTTSAMMNSSFRQCNNTAFRNLSSSVRIFHASAFSTVIRKRCYWTSHGENMRSLVSPIFATGSGMEASITDPKENAISVKNANIIVESQDDGRIQVRVDLNGEDTRVVFDKVLTNLARSAPPVPGFRRQKGGKTSKVPKDFLLQMLGEERVTKFVIQEIVSSTLANYAQKENIKVKDKKINTVETAEELRSSFKPGNEFGFSAILEVEEETVAEISSSSSSSSSALVAES